MLDIVSHEFRAPLNLIGGYAQALKSKTLGEVTEEQEQALAKILNQSENLLHLVNSMLGLTRIEAGELSVERETIDLTEYLRDMSHRYDAPLEKPVSLQWSFASDLPKINSDRGKLTIILQNLIINAIKFTEKGSIHISARRAADKGVEFGIADTGIGIPKEALSIIFENSAKWTAHRPGSMVGLALDCTSYTSSRNCSGVSSTWKANPGGGQVLHSGCHRDLSRLNHRKDT